MRRRELIAVLLLATTMRPARAQQSGRVYRIAVIHPSRPVADMSETGSHPFFRALFGQLRRLGYVEGQNLTVERYSGQGRIERYPGLVRDVTHSNPDVIFTVSSQVAKSFKEATTNIPVVGIMADPAALGIVASLAKPGGNITGVVPDAGIELHEKYIELLREAVPRVSKVAFLVPRLEESAFGAALLDGAQRVGISLVGAPLETPVQEVEYRRAFAAMAQQHVDAVIISNSAENYTHSQLIAGLAEKGRLPTMCPERMFVEAGGLMSYGADYPDLYRHAAGQIDSILRGAKPSEIPMYRATKFEMVINVKTAKALGIDLPPSLLARADEVIE